MVTVDLIEPGEVREVLAWWPERGMGELDPCLLPPCGFVARRDGQAVASAWLYEPEGCEVGMVDWLITRPGQSTEQAREACHAICEAIEQYASVSGIRMLFASACRQQMAREMEACGFVVTARDVIHLAKAPGI